MTTRTPPKIPRPTPAPRVQSPTMTPGAQPSAEEFWASVHGRTPLVEAVPDSPGERIFTFLWHDDEADEVLLFANRLTDERDLDRSLMQRIPGTDIWHLSYRMRADWRASYGFLRRLPGQRWPWTKDEHLTIRRSLDQAMPDPHNPSRCRNRSGTELSVVNGPDAPPQSWLASRDHVRRGTVTQHLAPDGRTVWIGAPTAPPKGPLPVVVLFDGDVWTSTQDAMTTADNLVADGLVRPALYVMVEAGSREQRWRDLDGDAGVTTWIADRLLPWVRERWTVTTDPAEVVVAGQSLGGLAALRTVLERPDAVGAAISQSASLWRSDLAHLIDGRDLSGRRFYIEVGLQEWVLYQPNEHLAERLAGAGAAVEFVAYNGGHDYACWRGGLADGLSQLLPPTQRTPRV